LAEGGVVVRPDSEAEELPGEGGRRWTKRPRRVRKRTSARARLRPRATSRPSAVFPAEASAAILRMAEQMEGFKAQMEALTTVVGNLVLTQTSQASEPGPSVVDQRDASAKVVALRGLGLAAGGLAATSAAAPATLAEPAKLASQQEEAGCASQTVERKDDRLEDSKEDKTEKSAENMEKTKEERSKMNETEMEKPTDDFNSAISEIRSCNSEREVATSSSDNDCEDVVRKWPGGWKEYHSTAFNCPYFVSSKTGQLVWDQGDMDGDAFFANISGEQPTVDPSDDDVAASDHVKERQAPAPAWKQIHRSGCGGSFGGGAAVQALLEVFRYGKVETASRQVALATLHPETVRRVLTAALQHMQDNGGQLRVRASAFQP